MWLGLYERVKILVLVAALAVCLSVDTADAQDSEWDFFGTLYLFAPATTTQVGDVEAELSFSDAFENLNFAFFGAFEASNGTWSFIADYMYTDLAFSEATSGPIFTGVDARATINVLTGYAAYRVYSDGRNNVDAGLGLRWFDTSTEIEFTGGPAVPSQTFDGSWVDPLLMVRLQSRLADRWVGGIIGDYGGFFSDRDTYQVTINV